MLHYTVLALLLLCTPSLWSVAALHCPDPLVPDPQVCLLWHVPYQLSNFPLPPTLVSSELALSALVLQALVLVLQVLVLVLQVLVPVLQVLVPVLQVLVPVLVSPAPASPAPASPAPASPALVSPAPASPADHLKYKYETGFLPVCLPESGAL